MPYIVDVSLNVLLALVTTVTNILVLSALRKNTSLHLPSKLLLGSLVLTDLGVGAVGEPLFAVFLVSKIKGDLNISCFTCASSGITASLLACVSLLTMGAISLDRYIALYFHLRYRDIVTTKRVSAVLVVIWLFAGFYAFLWLWNPTLHAYIFNAVISVSFIIITLSYIMIYRGLRHQQLNQATDQTQFQTQQQAANPLNVARYRRSAADMLWIYGLFVLCYLPYALNQDRCTTCGPYCLYTMRPRICCNSLLFQLLLKSPRLLLPPAWDSRQCSGNTLRNLRPKSSAVNPSIMRQLRLTRNLKHENGTCTLLNRS